MPPQEKAAAFRQDRKFLRLPVDFIPTWVTCPLRSTGITPLLRYQPRRSKNRKGKFFINFSPAVSNKAAKAIRDTFRRWNLPNRSDKAIEDLSRMFNPTIRGWLQYYGRYYRSALYPTMRALNQDLVLWAKRKYKKLRRHHRRAASWIARISRRAPELFAHWQMGVRRGSMVGAV